MTTIGLNELVLEKIDSVALLDPNNDDVSVRLTNVRDGSLSSTAEGTAVTDNVGSTIMTLYNASAATLSATNAVFSMDLAAAQFGEDKQVASASTKIDVPTYEILTVAESKITLPKTPKEGSVKYAYKLVNNGIAEKLELTTGAAATGKFTISTNELTFFSDVEAGTQIYVEYEYESTTASKVSKKSDKFPGVYKARVYVVMHNICNKNEIYTGVLVSNRAEIDPTSIEIGIASDSGHPFTLQFNKEYCSTDSELFSIIVDE